VIALLGDDGVQQVGDLLLTGGSLIELAAHIGKPCVHLLLEASEARGGLFAESVDR